MITVQVRSMVALRRGGADGELLGWLVGHSSFSDMDGSYKGVLPYNYSLNCMLVLYGFL